MFSITEKQYVFKGARNCSSLVSMTIAHAVRGEHCGYCSVVYQNLVILKNTWKSPFVKIVMCTFVLQISGDVPLPHLPPRHYVSAKGRNCGNYLGNSFPICLWRKWWVFVRSNFVNCSRKMTKGGAPQNGSFIEGVCMYQCTVIHYFIFLTISHFLCFLQLTLAVSADSLKCSEKNRLEGHHGAMPSTSYKSSFPIPLSLSVCRLSWRIRLPHRWAVALGSGQTWCLQLMICPCLKVRNPFYQNWNSTRTQIHTVTCNL